MSQVWYRVGPVGSGNGWQCMSITTHGAFYFVVAIFSPQQQGLCLILRKVKEVRVPLLLKVRFLLVPRSEAVWAGEGCGSQAGTMSNFRGVILRGDRGCGQSRHKLTTTDPNRTTKDVNMTRSRTCHWNKHDAVLQHIQWNKGRKGTVTVQLTHASRGICSRPSSPGGCVLATPREQDDHQGDGTPSLSVFNHKEHKHACKRFSHHSYELSHPVTHTHTHSNGIRSSI